VGEPHRIGIVGLGVISQAYLSTLEVAASVQVVAVADLGLDRARAVAAALPGVRAMTTAELLAHPEVDTVLNLTIPAAHAEIALAAIAHGKSVYGEKPLAATLADAEGVLDAARTAGVRVGCAPDTVLGTGIQTARAAIDGGAIGVPFAASAVMVTPGHERWHPQPDFYYREGGGPLLDMGPYYVAALIQLLGPVVSVIGSASRRRDARTILTGPRAGRSIDIEVDTHVSGVLTHASGALSTITTSFDGVATTAAPIEVHGELGITQRARSQPVRRRRAHRATGRGRLARCHRVGRVRGRGPRRRPHRLRARGRGWATRTRERRGRSAQPRHHDGAAGLGPLGRGCGRAFHGGATVARAAHRQGPLGGVTA